MKTIALSSEPRLVVPYLQQADVFQRLPYHSVWEAFRAGMYALLRYANRSEVDLDQIAESNLNFLHRTLMADSEYRKILKETTDLNTNTRSITTLLSTPDLTARIHTLQQNSKCQFFTDADHINMLLVIAGKVTVKCSGNSVKARFGQRSYIRSQRKNYAKTRILKKEGSVILFEMDGHGMNAILSSEKGGVLLHIYLRTQPDLSHNYLRCN